MYIHTLRHCCCLPGSLTGYTYTRNYAFITLIISACGIPHRTKDQPSPFSMREQRCKDCFSSVSRFLLQGWHFIAETFLLFAFLSLDHSCLPYLFTIFFVLEFCCLSFFFFVKGMCKFTCEDAARGNYTLRMEIRSRTQCWGVFEALMEIFIIKWRLMVLYAKYLRLFEVVSLVMGIVGSNWCYTYKAINTIILVSFTKLFVFNISHLSYHLDLNWN